jgi:hypothetical protein
MPLRQYFAWVGSILLAGLFVADWCFPAPPARAPRPEIPPHERVNLRIRSNHQWPERVVFDTTGPRLASAPDVSPQPDILSDQSPVQTGQHALLDAFAAIAPYPPNDRQQEMTKPRQPTQSRGR